MKRIHGRVGEPLEFVEFRCVNKKGVQCTFATQRAGDLWHVYQMFKDGGIHLVRQSLTSLKKAESFTEKVAQKFEDN